MEVLERTEKEMIKISIEEFSRLQDYMSVCDKDSEVYGAVKALNIGDKIDMEGFLYWYEGVNPHITSVKAAE